jgi:phosphoribosylaminoimidazole carboxylase PurE protein
MLVVIVMGSPSDAEFGHKIAQALNELGVPWEMRVASAHKVPRYVLDMLEAYEADPQPKVYITVAGRSNALSGLVDAQVSAPVIAARRTRMRSRAAMYTRRCACHLASRRQWCWSRRTRRCWRPRC